MAGHSKWANIKHSKARVDAKRGKIFTKHIRAITVAARTHGPDINANPSLRLAVDKALNDNMPKDTIQRAINRGAGLEEGITLMQIRYEGYGPNGVAVIVDCLTDNKNRTVAEVRHAFTKCGGNLGTDGSVAYLFAKRGFITFEPQQNEEKIMEIALESGAEDITTNEDGSIDVTTDPETFEVVRDAMKKANLPFISAEITLLAATNVSLSDEAAAEKMLRLNDMLEDLDDVQAVYSNATIADEIYEKMRSG
ncbi:MAG: hypothetical protein A3F10_04210 [Coxiella sp. RIFCSPHIGHO2_12_FULL_42_15]|nr:MAG: hypothetical protein A3F10_04210 [Coxiella sp. RIFCSPHIGHO2_12_FULL_42_15]